MQRAGAWSLTHDERDQGFIGSNWLDIFLRRRMLTFSRIREVATTAKDYAAAVTAMKSAPLSAPSYFVLAGVQPGEGVLLTRGRDAGDVDAYELQPDAGRWYLVETNYDHWASPGHGDDRRHPAERALEAMTRAQVSPAGVMQVLSDQTCNATRGERNVLNADTVYTAVMQPGQQGLQVVLRTTPRAECGGSVPVVEASLA